MAEENFEQLLDDLRNKKIDHFVITPRIFSNSNRFFTRMHTVRKLKAKRSEAVKLFIN